MKYKGICGIANLTIFAIPLAALVGWIFEIQVLKTFMAPNNIGMNPMSVVCFMFLGTAFYFARNRPERNVHSALAVFPLIVGLAQLSEYVLSIDVRLDQLFFTESLKGNIMSPNAAGTFVLACLAVMTSRMRTYKGFSLTSVLTLAVAWMGLLACTGYLYGVTALYGVSEYIPMALNTAVTFMFFSLGMLFVKHDQEPSRTFLSDTAGGRLARYLIPPAMLFPVASAWIRLQGDALGWYEPKLGVTLFVLINVLAWGVALWFTAFWLYKADLKNKHLMELLAKKAKIDALTGLWNRRYFDERLDAAYAALERHGHPFSCIVADVDFFKKVNDNLGHPFGDHVLKRVAEIFVNASRKEDIVCRMGGEEFVIILPDTNLDMAAEVAERLRSEIAKTPIENGEVAIKVTCSFGVAQATNRNEPIMDVADARLYKAKQSGRNRCISSDLQPLNKVA